MSTVGVIVISYNRPRMLAEALASIDGADQVVLVDDGSDFDVERVLKRAKLPNASMIANPSHTLAERLTIATCGALINAGLRAVTCDYVGYLCDDDLFAPGWLQAAAAFMDREPSSHMVRGDWLKFNDGESLDLAVPCNWTFAPELTTGNFVHRAACTFACNCWWSESTIASHDSSFLDNYLRMHGATGIEHIGVLAGYRREHTFNMLNFSNPSHNGYLPAAEAVLAGGLLE